MASMKVPGPAAWTVADLAELFGPMPASRIRTDPPPGRATEQDVIDLEAREDRLYELVEGVLVEKTVGYYESYLAAFLIRMLGNFVAAAKLGIVAGEAGMMRLAAGLVRIPDVSFVSWDRLPGRRVPREPIPDLAPDLAVEVLSESNTAREMERKLHDYFAAGVRLVWYVDPEARTVRVYTAPDQSALLREEDTLDGGAVPPGFALPLRELFAEPAGA
jgi:Uma2 family endonuclease